MSKFYRRFGRLFVAGLVAVSVTFTAIVPAESPANAAMVAIVKVKNSPIAVSYGKSLDYVLDYGHRRYVRIVATFSKVDNTYATLKEVKVVLSNVDGLRVLGRVSVGESGRVNRVGKLLTLVPGKPQTVAVNKRLRINGKLRPWVVVQVTELTGVIIPLTVEYRK